LLGIDDSNRASTPNNGNGVIEPTERIIANIEVSNTGQGIAANPIAYVDLEGAWMAEIYFIGMLMDEICVNLC
jgi:hypothetical protein